MSHQGPRIYPPPIFSSMQPLPKLALLPCFPVPKGRCVKTVMYQSSIAQSEVPEGHWCSLGEQKAVLETTARKANKPALTHAFPQGWVRVGAGSQSPGLSRSCALILCRGFFPTKLNDSLVTNLKKRSLSLEFENCMGVYGIKTWVFCREQCKLWSRLRKAFTKSLQDRRAP